MKRWKKWRSRRLLNTLRLLPIALVSLVPLAVLLAQTPDSVPIELEKPTIAAGQIHESKATPQGRCPFLYTKNKKGWNFQSDMYPPGLLGSFSNFGRKSPFPLDYNMIRNGDIEAINGILSIKVAQEIDDISYLDSLEMLAIDHSKYIEIISDIAGTAGYYNYWNGGNPAQGLYSAIVLEGV